MRKTLHLSVSLVLLLAEARTIDEASSHFFFPNLKSATSDGYYQMSTVGAAIEQYRFHTPIELCNCLGHEKLRTAEEPQRRDDFLLMIRSASHDGKKSFAMVVIRRILGYAHVSGTL